MDETSITGADIAMLRDILQLAQIPSGRSATAATFEMLDLVEHLVHSDDVSFQHLHVHHDGRLSRSYVQATEGGAHGSWTGAELVLVEETKRGDPLMQRW